MPFVRKIPANLGTILTKSSLRSRSLPTICRYLSLVFNQFSRDFRHSGAGNGLAVRGRSGGTGGLILERKVLPIGDWIRRRFGEDFEKRLSLTRISREEKRKDVSLTRKPLKAKEMRVNSVPKRMFTNHDYCCRPPEGAPNE